MKHYPIRPYKGQIVTAVNNNAVVIITAETGAGKTTQVPQYLIEAGYSVVVTQPRRLAAVTVAERVAEECRSPIGGLIGYRTAMDRKDSKDTRCLFVTDGLAMVRELMTGGTADILILDEVHEWNLNIEVLVAWAKHQVKNGGRFKLVLMSATLDADRLSEYFDGAPVIRLPGRLYPVEERDAGASLIKDVAVLVREGRNVLVFQPGVREIEETIQELSQMRLGAVLLPLHGKLSREEQRRCFQHYDRPKVVVATNVAQTSVTIDDIDAVVDSGLERRTETFEGVEGLYIRPISLADREQRKGRAGRTRPGVYIDHCPAKTGRPRYPVAEILRTSLEKTYLRLASAGFRMEELPFFHQPAETEIEAARKLLIALGLLDKAGPTRVGRRVNRMPVSVRYGRMIVEAEKLGVVDDVITIVSILEEGGIVFRKDPAWRELIQGEKLSDWIAQLLVWKAARRMSKDELRKNGISPKSYFKAREIRRRLSSMIRPGSSGSSPTRENILRAVCVGFVDRLYRHGGGKEYVQGRGSRQLSRDSVITGQPAFVVGIPFDLEFKLRRGGKGIHRLLVMASAVDPNRMLEIAPHMVRSEEVDVRVRDGKIEALTRYSFGDTFLMEDWEEVLDHPDAKRLFADDAWRKWRPDKSESTDVPKDLGIFEDIYYRAEDGQCLVAYGAYVRRWDGIWHISWHRSRDAAENDLRESKAYLAEIRFREESRAVIEEINEELRSYGEPLIKISSDGASLNWGYNYYSFDERGMNLVRQNLDRIRERAQIARERREAERWLKENDVPSHIADAIGDAREAKEFVARVDALDKERLLKEEHEILWCGRERRRRALIRASGNGDFWGRVDPNCVSLWVWERVVGTSGRYYGTDKGDERVEPEREAPQKPESPTNLNSLMAKFNRHRCG